MFQKVLLAVAFQRWDVPTPYAYTVREVATPLAKGSSHPLAVLSVYTVPVRPLAQPLLVRPEIMEDSKRLLRAEEGAPRAMAAWGQPNDIHSMRPHGVHQGSLLNTPDRTSQGEPMDGTSLSCDKAKAVMSEPSLRPEKP
jgi:hypothetical protein